MELYLAFAAFLLGAIVASFAGVLAGRLNTGEGFVHGRSRCDACGEELDGFDLVPILSYVANGGRARCCGAHTSLWAPLAETALGLLYALAYLSFGIVPALLVLYLALALVLALVLYDLAHMVLPAALSVPFVASSALFAYLAAPTLQSFYLILIYALGIAAVLAALHFVSGGRWMGLMDAPLAFGLALIAGPHAVIGFAYSFWIGAVIGILLLLGRPAGSRMNVEVPFAPFLALGFLLALFTPWDPFQIITTLIGASPL